MPFNTINCYLDSSEIKNSNWKTRKLKKKKSLQNFSGSFQHMKLFHFLSWAEADCVCHANELPGVRHLHGQDRKTYYTLCLTSIVLTHGLMRPNSHRQSNGNHYDGASHTYYHVQIAQFLFWRAFSPFLFPLFYFHRLGEPTKCTTQRKEIDRIRSASECWTITPPSFLVVQI